MSEEITARALAFVLGLFVCVEVLWPSQPNGVMSNRTEQNFINLTTSQATHRKCKRREKKQKKNKKKQNYIMTKASNKVYKYTLYTSHTVYTYTHAHTHIYMCAGTRVHVHTISK